MNNMHGRPGDNTNLDQIDFDIRDIRRSTWVMEYVFSSFCVTMAGVDIIAAVEEWFCSDDTLDAAFKEFAEANWEVFKVRALANRVNGSDNGNGCGCVVPTLLFTVPSLPTGAWRDGGTQA